MSLASESPEGAQEYSLGLQPQVGGCKEESALKGRRNPEPRPFRALGFFSRLFLGLKPQAVFPHPFGVYLSEDKLALMPARGEGVGAARLG